MSYIINLLRRFKQGEQEVFSEILDDVNPLVKQMVSKYSRNKYVKKDHNEDDIRSVVYETVFKVCVKFDFERFSDGIKTTDDIGHEKKYYALLRREMKNRMVYEVFKWGGDQKYKNSRRCHGTVSLDARTKDENLVFSELFSKGESPLSIAIEAELREKLRMSLCELSRQVFDLKLEGYTIPEISRKMNITTQNVNSFIQERIIPSYNQVVI